MKAVVTGATGFLGGLLVRELLADGVETRVLVRADSDTRWLTGLSVEIAFGDLRDVASLRAALEGCDTLFHVAAFYSTREIDAPLMHEINVAGTENILCAAAELGYARAVHTSTIGTIGRPADGSLPNEDAAFNLWDTASAYARSKVLGEQAALEAAQKGLPVVVVNPTSPVGPFDVKPSSSGRRVLDVMAGRMPSFPPGGLNVVAARDVARGHILAARRGELGRRYILGNVGGNLDLGQFVQLTAEAAGVPEPHMRQRSRLGKIRSALRRSALVQPGHLPTALTCDCRRALEELGMPQTPLREALAEAARWFRENGYLDRR